MRLRPQASPASPLAVPSACTAGRALGLRCITPAAADFCSVVEASLLGRLPPVAGLVFGHFSVSAKKSLRAKTAQKGPETRSLYVLLVIRLYAHCAGCPLAGEV